jgi:hypothetical protein
VLSSLRAGRHFRLILKALVIAEHW